MKTTMKVIGIGIILTITCVATAKLKAQNIYVENGGNGSTGSGSIGEYGLDGSVINRSLISGIQAPQAIAISGNDLFVSNAGTNSTSGAIGEYTTSGSTVNATFISGLDQPQGIAVSGNDLFFASYNPRAGLGGSSFISEYNTTSGLPVGIPSAITGLEKPVNIAISGNDLFVLNEIGTIAEYTTSGQVLNASLIIGLNGPEGFGVSGNDIFVANGPGTISEYTASGALVNASLITGLDSPYGMAISGNHLFVANWANGTIGEYTTSGQTINPSLITGLDDPVGIAITPEPSTVALAGLGALALWLWSLPSHLLSTVPAGRSPSRRSRTSPLVRLLRFDGDLIRVKNESSSDE